MQILLTNDDGIFAPGLAALEEAVSPLGNVCLVAPAAEQSGVGHAITFLQPLVAKEIFVEEQRRGWAVEGSPADCVKLGVVRFSGRRPDAVISGINSGLNAGINVLYSGTVAAAIEGAFFGITSIAVSLEYDEHAAFDRAAQLAGQIIQGILAQPGAKGRLFNVNIPIAALSGEPEVCVVPMDVRPWGEQFEERQDPRGQPYFWATGASPDPLPGQETDLSVLAQGHISVTPLHFDMTDHSRLAPVEDWGLSAR